LHLAETELYFSTVASVKDKFTFTMLTAYQLSVPGSSGKLCYVPVPWLMEEYQETPNLGSTPSDIRTPPHRHRASPLNGLMPMFVILFGSIPMACICPFSVKLYTFHCCTEMSTALIRQMNLQFYFGPL
jgi:hypothetical protein